MFNVRNLLLAASAAAIITSCGGNGARTEAAQNLLEQARTLAAAHDYDSAIVVLDTLDRSYRDCLAERRAGTAVRLEALSALTRDSLASADLQLRAVDVTLDSLAPRFRHIDVAATSGYSVYSDAYTGSEMNSNSLQARVDPEGYLFIVANVNKAIGLNAIAYGGAEARGESVKIEGSEIMSLMQEGSSELVNAICNATPGAVVRLSGTKGKVEVKLDKKAIAAFRASRAYATALQQKRRLSISAEKLERQLQKLGDQQAQLEPIDN